jgi:lipoyl(octanoyl) transferase
MRFTVRDLGRVPHGEAEKIQAALLENVVEKNEPSTLLLVEHPAVLTLGAGFHADNLLLPEHEYAARGIEVCRTNRGGDVTYHGPGQLVAYPIFDLNEIGRDLHLWLRNLEEVVILAVSDFGIEARRAPPHTGAWVGDRKIAAIGVRIRKWVSMHGVAINCDIDLAPFGLIVPCGIKGYGVTSITRELGRRVTVEEAKSRVIDAFVEVFA